MKAMINNEKGSVLSVALMVIVILTFALSATTSYTVSVATRTTALNQTQDDDIIARTRINMARHELVMFISGLTEEEFNNEDTNYLIYSFIKEADPDTGRASLEDRYFVEIEDRTTETMKPARQYRIRYTKLDGTVIYRDLFVSRSEEEDNPDDDLQTIIDGISSDEDTEEYSCTGDECIDMFKDAVNWHNAPGQPHSAELENNILIEGDIVFEGQQQTGTLDLNGYAMYIDGNFTMRDFVEIIGPGIIVVSGNYYLEQFENMDIYDNVLILVQGKTDMDFTHSNAGRRRLTMTDSAIMSFNVNGILNGAEEEGVSYVEYLINNDYGDIHYIGDIEQFDGVSWSYILNEFDLELGSDYDFSQGSFQEEE